VGYDFSENLAQMGNLCKVTEKNNTTFQKLRFYGTVDIVEVDGSNPLPPTIFFDGLSKIPSSHFPLASVGKA
jgi:hypothetical protein